MEKHRNRNMYPTNNRFESSSNIPKCFQFGDEPPSNPLYPDPRSSKREELMGSNNSKFGSINKPPWQKNREQEPSDWRDLVQGQSWDRRSLDNSNFADRMQIEPSKQNPNSRNIPQNWDDNGMSNKPKGRNWNDGPRGPQEPQWISDSFRPNQEGNSMGSRTTWIDETRPTRTNWDDALQGSSRPNRDDSSRGPSGPNWNDGPRGPSGSKWDDDGPRGSFGQNWDDGPRRTSGSRDVGPRGPMGPNWDDGPKGPSGSVRDNLQSWRSDGPSQPNWNDGPRISSPSNWDSGPRGPLGPNMDDGPRGPSGPNWDDGPRRPREMTWDDDARGPQESSWNDVPRGPSEAYMNEERSPFCSDRDNRFRGAQEPDWREEHIGGGMGPSRFSNERMRGPEDCDWMGRQPTPGGDQMPMDLMDQEYTNRFREFEGDRDENRPRGPPSQRQGRNPSPRRRIRSPERNVWSRLDSDGNWGNDKRSKRPRISEREILARIEEETMAIREREGLNFQEAARSGPIPGLFDRPDQIAATMDLRAKLTRKEGPLKVEDPNTPKDVLILPRKGKQKYFVKDLEAIKESLIKKLYDIAELGDIDSKPQLRFLSVKMVSRRRIVVSCQNDATVKWLLDWYPLGLRVRVRLVLLDDLHSLAVIGFIVKGVNKVNTETLKNNLTSQNPGLDVSAWRNGAVKSTRKGQAYGFLVDGHTVRYLTANKWELFYEMQKLFVRRIKSVNSLSIST